jgi:iron complex outermembrane receptor protein
MQLASKAGWLAIGATLAIPSFAQSTTEAAATSAEPVEIEEVLVTGSRLATGFDTPTPVAMFDSATLVATAPSNLGEALGQLPSLSGSVQNTTSGGGSGNGGVNGQNLLNLRQLGPNRTLILLDGQRMGVTNVVNSVDINIIPQALVKRVDIVTGGASASYGSDAVAGVVNFILDTTYEGLKFDVNGGITSRSDAPNGRASVAFGRALGERGRMIGGLEYFKMNGFKYGEEIGRDWFDHPTGAWPNPVANAKPTILQTYDAKSEFGSYGGTITAVQGCPAGATGDACRGFVNQQFLPGGALAPFNFGINHAGFAGGGDGAIVNQPFTPNAERKGLFLHGEFDLTQDLIVWAQGSFNQSDTFLQAQVASQLATTQFTIAEDNAYLPTAIKSVLNSTAGNQTFSLTRYDRDMGFQEVTGNTQVKRFSTGLKGRLTDTWSYDTTLAYQDTHQELDIRNTILRNLYAAADAVVNPANGRPSTPRPRARLPCPAAPAWMRVAYRSTCSATAA